MIPILSSDQIREADQYTIQNEPIASIDLMERASEAFVHAFLSLFTKKEPVNLFCGTGNNGGDGLAIARLLMNEGWEVAIYIVGDPTRGSNDFKTNLERIKEFKLVQTKADFPSCENKMIIDAIFGSGLSRPIEGIYKDLVVFLNGQNTTSISVDIASGLFADQPMTNDVIAFEPDFTISFQVPKLVFFLPECHQNVGEWKIVDIGLNKSFINKCTSSYYLTSHEDVKSLLPVRQKFTHKNSVGRLMIVAGSKGKMGAAILCSQAAFRGGVGLLNVCVPTCGTQIMQLALPEAMVIESLDSTVIDVIPKTNDTVAIGPGIGTDAKTINAFSTFLSEHKDPIVLDADAINILALHQELLSEIPAGSILTPHPGEFKRLVGDWKNDVDKLEKLRNFCKAHEVNMVVKGAYSAVCDKEGIIHFNPTGNPGLATAGSGDVLTGIIGAFLAQGLAPFHALLLGVYLHGLSGDLAVESVSSGWIQASDVVAFLPEAIASLHR